MTELEQQRMFRGAPAAVAVSAVWLYPGGWTATVTVRREGESWEAASRDAMDCLSTLEAYDAICASLAVQLGL